MRQKYFIKLFIILFIGIFVFSFSGCYETNMLSKMKFNMSALSDEIVLQIISSSPKVSIAGNKERIVYIDLEGNIVCYDCATNMEKILVKATSSGKSYSAGAYSSIVLDGNKVYYRVFGLSQWDTIYCLDIESCEKQKIGEIYMDSAFYVKDGNVYDSEKVSEQLSPMNDPYADYYFNDRNMFIVCNNKAYQQMDNRDIVAFDLESGEKDIILCSDSVRLFYSNRNDIYYVSEMEFGEIKDGKMYKIIDLQNYDISYGNTNIQKIGNHIVVGNGCDNYIYNSNTNSLEASFSYGMGPYFVNGELVYRFDSNSYSFLDYFEEIGEGYYSLNIEKAIEAL